MSLPHFNLGRHSGAFLPIIVVIFSVTMGAGFALVFTPNDPAAIALLYVLTLAQLLPLALVMATRTASYLPFILLNQFVTYSVVQWFDLVTKPETAGLTTATAAALRELIVCGSLLAAAYVAVRILLFRGDSPLQAPAFEKLQISKRVAFVALAVMYAAPLLGKKHLTSNAVSAGLQVLSMYFLLGSRIVNHPRLNLLVQLAVLPGCLLSFLVTGFLVAFVNYFWFSFTSAWLRQRYRELSMIIAVMAMLVPLQMIKANYRSVVWERNPELGLTGRAALVGRLIAEEHPDGLMDEVEKPPGDTFSVLSRLYDDSFEQVLRLTPSVVPFWEGETYAMIPFIIIPRFLYPDKPILAFWNKFGRLYRYLSADDYDTNVSVSYLAEAYMNFGLIGMYLCALFVGALVASVERFSAAVFGVSNCFSYVAMLQPVLVCTYDMATLLSSVIVIGAAMLLLRTFLRDLIVEGAPPSMPEPVGGR